MAATWWASGMTSGVDIVPSATLQCPAGGEPRNAFLGREMEIMWETSSQVDPVSMSADSVWSLG